MFDIFYIAPTKDIQFKKLKTKFFTIKFAKDIFEAQRKSVTKFFYTVYDNCIVSSDFNFDYVPDDCSQDVPHLFLNDVYYDNIALIPKKYHISAREAEYRFFVNKKQVEILASTPKKYDRFTIQNFTDYKYAMECSETEMFYASSPNIDISQFNFDMYFEYSDLYNRHENHAFIHRVEGIDYYNGLFLLSKHKPVTAREIEYRHLVGRKEHNIVASTPVQYDVFNVETYDDYLHALDNTKTELFWATTPNIETSYYRFDLYFTHDDEYNRKENHALAHLVNGKKYHNGLFLLSKHKPLSRKEIEYRHLVSGKEWDIVGSFATTYERFVIDSYEMYKYAMEWSKTELFWACTPNINTGDFDFSQIYFTHDDEYNRKENHAFIHHVDGVDYYNGLFLLSKHKPVTEREIEYRHLVSRKEHDLVASGPVEYDSFIVDTYEDYQHALTQSSTELFYAIPTQVQDVELPKLYFTHDNEYHRKENHTFKNLCNSEEKDNGVFLCSKYKELSKRELEHRHIVYKKPWDIIVSKHKPYDVVFMSYDEAAADKHYEELLIKAPHATRVHGVKGIHQAHIQAAKQSTSEMVWIVDADAVLMEDFNFDLFVEKWDRETVHVWRSKNPINDLVYGYGGVKLFPRELTINMDTSKPDMTTSITERFRAVQVISNITAFNVDEFSTWKSAFRECCKLSSKVIDRQKAVETEERLDIWCTVGADKEFGEYAIAGAKAGREYGYQNKNNVAALKLINDFDWLRNYYGKEY